MRKRLFNDFEVGFAVFVVPFLEHWTLFCFNKRFGSQDTSENINWIDFKLGVRHYPFYF